MAKLKLLRKLFMRSKGKYTKIDKAKEPKTVSSRTTRPAHFLFKIVSFTKLSDILSKSGVENYESPEFECGGHKWKLSLYPSGNTKLGGDDHISLYLVTAEAEINSLGSSDVCAMFKLFIFDQKRDRYLTIEDSEVRRFHSMKTEWGFTRLISLKAFKNVKNGYLVDDSCIFGVEILVIPSVVKSACFLLIERPTVASFTWKIDKFSSLNDEFHYSDPFTVMGYEWKLVVCPGEPIQNVYSMSLSLVPQEFCEGSKIYVECDLAIKREAHSGYPLRRSYGGWFCESHSSSIWMHLLLSYLKDDSEGSIVNDSIIVEAKITAISKVITSESE